MSSAFPPPDEFGRVPMCPPPPGVKPNFDNPHSIGVHLIITCIVCSVFSSVFTGLRLHTRIYLTRCAGKEDAFVTIAWLACIVTAIMNILGVREGFGRNCWDFVQGTHSKNFLTLNWIASMLSIFSNMFTKLAVVQLMVRIASHRKVMRWTYYGLMAFIVVWNLATAGVVFFGCTPLKATWDKTVPNAKCINLQKAFIPYNIIDVAVSAAVFFAPFPLVWSSVKRLPLQQQFALFGIFAIGSLTIIVSAVRLEVTLGDLSNFSRATITIVNWWTIETTVSIVCACAFCLKAFAHRYFPALSGLSTSGRSSAPLGHTSGNTGKIQPKGGTTSSVGIAMHSMKLGGNKSRGFNTSVVVTNNDTYGERNGSEGELVRKDNYIHVGSEVGDAERIVTAGNIVVERTWEVKVASSRESIRTGAESI